MSQVDEVAEGHQFAMGTTSLAMASDGAVTAVRHQRRNHSMLLAEGAAGAEGSMHEAAHRWGKGFAVLGGRGYRFDAPVSRNWRDDAVDLIHPRSTDADRAATGERHLVGGSTRPWFGASRMWVTCSPTTGQLSAAAYLAWPDGLLPEAETAGLRRSPYATLRANLASFAPNGSASCAFHLPQLCQRTACPPRRPAGE